MNLPEDLVSNQLEQLIGEWLEFKGCIVRLNVKVGKLQRGGFDGELDVVAYSPTLNRVLHIESSYDALSWEKRIARYTSKFSKGLEHINKSTFRWLSDDFQLDQWAVLWAGNKKIPSIQCGENDCRIVPVWDLYKLISYDLKLTEDPTGHAIPEQFPLLRTMQYTLGWVPTPRIAITCPFDTPWLGQQ